MATLKQLLLSQDSRQAAYRARKRYAKPSPPLLL
jgi:hypothetical protein